MLIGGIALFGAGVVVLLVARVWQMLRPRRREAVLREIDRSWHAGIRSGLGREPTPDEWRRLGPPPSRR